MITFNNKQFPSWFIVNDIKRSIMGPHSLITIDVPGKPGTYFSRKKTGSLVISVDFTIKATSLMEFRSNVRELATILDTEEPSILVFDDELDKTYYAIVDGDTTISQINKIGKGSIDFYCPDPFAYGIEIQQSFTTALNVDGTATALPIFQATFTAASQDFKIQQVETGKMVRVIHNFVVGDVLVIDHVKRLITINDLRAMPSLDLDSEFFELILGVNTFNIIPANVATLTVSYKPRWL